MARTPIHPGEILADELETLGLSGAELARQIEVPANRIRQIIAGKRNITADTALRLAGYFGTTSSARGSPAVNLIIHPIPARSTSQQLSRCQRSRGFIDAAPR